MSLSARDLYQKLSQIESTEMVNIGVNEWLDSIDLHWEDNKDPADRMITAFAIKKIILLSPAIKKLKSFINMFCGDASFK